MKLRLTVLLLSVLMFFTTVLSSCGTYDDGSSVTAPQTTTVPKVGFVDPNYPLMDLMAEDLTKYVNIPDLSDLKIEYSVYVDDETLEKKLSELAKKNSYYIAEPSRETLEGDTLCVKYVGRIDGVAFSGGSAETAFVSLTENNGYIDGFAKDLYGIAPGTTVYTTVKFPDDYGVKEVNGKEAVFEITVKDIVGEYGFTDETISEYSAGTYTSYESFKEEYRNNLIVENLKAYENEIYDIALDTLESAATVITLPKAHVDSYFNIYYNDERAYYEAYADQFRDTYNIASFEAYRKFFGITDEWLKGSAEVSVAEDLVLVSAAKALGLEFTKDEYDDLIESLAENWGFDSVELFVSYYGKEYLKLCVIKDQAVKAFIATATVDSDYDEYKHLLGEEN